MKFGSYFELNRVINRHTRCFKLTVKTQARFKFIISIFWSTFNRNESIAVKTIPRPNEVFHPRPKKLYEHVL